MPRRARKSTSRAPGPSIDGRAAGRARFLVPHGAGRTLALTLGRGRSCRVAPAHRPTRAGLCPALTEPRREKGGGDRVGARQGPHRRRRRRPRGAGGGCKKKIGRRASSRSRRSSRRGTGSPCRSRGSDPGRRLRRGSRSRPVNGSGKAGGAGHLAWFATTPARDPEAPADGFAMPKRTAGARTRPVLLAPRWRRGSGGTSRWVPARRSSAGGRRRSRPATWSTSRPGGAAGRPSPA